MEYEDKKTTLMEYGKLPANKTVITAVLLLACTVSFDVLSAETPHWVHYKLLQNESKLPKKVVVLPINVEVIEVTAGGVKEEVPEWSAAADENVFKSLSAAIKKAPGLTEVKAPDFRGKTSKMISEHLALYKLVVNTATDVGWKHKIRRFDYGIGNGLSKLRKMTGADAAILVYGRDHVSTAGRKTKAVLSYIPIVNIFTGNTPTLGDSFIHVGIVDLKTGDLLWMNSEYRDDSSDLRESADTTDIVNTVFEWYPGIEKYRDAYIK